MEITEILDEIGIDYIDSGHEHCRPGWIQLDCPRCTPNAKHWRLGYNLQYGYSNCWSCGAVSMMEVLEYHELDSRQNRLLVRSARGPGPRRVEKQKAKLKLPKRLGPMLSAHRKYLKDRGFNPDKLEGLWDLKGIGYAAKLAWRIFIPVYRRGEIVTWTTRSLNDSGTRYISASGDEAPVNIKHVMYGGDYVRHTCLVFEGPTDVWSVGPGAIATCGTSYSRSQVLAISRVPTRYICFDSETAAQRRARQLCSMLEVLPGNTFLVQLDAKDASLSTPKEKRALRKLLK